MKIKDNFVSLRLRKGFDVEIKMEISPRKEDQMKIKTKIVEIMIINRNQENQSPYFEPARV